MINYNVLNLWSLLHVFSLKKKREKNVASVLKRNILRHDVTMLQIFIIACNARCASQTRHAHFEIKMKNSLGARKYRKLIAAVLVYACFGSTYRYPISSVLIGIIVGRSLSLFAVFRAE